MNSPKPDSALLAQIVDIVVRLGVVLILVVWSFNILKPFLLPVIWGIIMAVACYPGYQILVQRLGGRRKLAACIVSMLLLLIIILPSVLFADSLFSGLALAKDAWQGGYLRIPPPSEKTKDWPLIGQSAYDFWSLASRNITEALKPFAPHFKSLLTQSISVLAGAGFALLQFIFSIVIAGVFLAASVKGGHAATTLSERLGDSRGLELLKDAEITVRNVARGILGVALIQAMLAGIGFVVAGLPGAGLWALVALILGIVQIGVAPVMIVAALYLFSTDSTLTAGFFLIWTCLVVPLDNILKPVLLGKGAPVPMLVIFLGSLGGFFNSGIIGLFVGAVVLSLAYKLTILWVEEGHHPAKKEVLSKNS